MAHEKPLFSFGVITDIQYADVPDGRSFRGNPRYYRDSLSKTQRAVEQWNSMTLPFVLQLGDIIDGQNKDNSIVATDRVLQELKKFNGRVYHTIGNHCLYHVPRDHLLKVLEIDTLAEPLKHHDKHEIEVAYYAFSPHPGWKIIMLDSFDVSVVGRKPSHPHHTLASEILHTRNPSSNKNDPPSDLKHRCITAFNGGIGKRQLEWFEHHLVVSSKRNEKVIVGTHIPFHTDAAVPSATLYNHEEVRAVVRRYPCVVVCLTGHDHEGGYAMDQVELPPESRSSCSGDNEVEDEVVEEVRLQHHCIVEAVLECPPSMDAHGRVDVFSDRIELKGEGRVSSFVMPFSTSKRVVVQQKEGRT